MEYTKKQQTNFKITALKKQNPSFLKIIHPPKKENLFYPLAQKSWDEVEHTALINQLYSGKLTMVKMS